MTFKTLSLILRETIKPTVLAEFNHNPLLGAAVYKKGLFIILLTYIPGMITHAMDALIKVIFTSGYLIFAIGSSLLAGLTLGRIKSFNQLAKISWILTFDGTLVIGIDMIGMVIPPLAYKIDYALFENFTKKAFPSLQNPYQEGAW